MHGGVLLLVVLALVCGGSLIGVGRRALAANRGGGGKGRGGMVAGWLAHRRALRLEQVRHENATERDKERHKHRLAEQDAARRAKTGADEASDGGTGGRLSAVGPVRGKVIRLGDEPGGGSRPGGGPSAPPPPGSAPAAGAGGSPPTSGTPGAGPGAAPGSPPAGPRPGAGPSRQPPARGGPDSRPAPSHQQSPTRNGGVMTVMPDEPGAVTVPGVEMIIEGAAALRRHMMSGNAQAKRRGILGISLAGDALAGTVQAVAREMAEPGQHYGPEVTDPLAMTAVHYAAAGIGLSEVEGRLTAIIHAAQELAARGVQAPHHEQMTAG